LYIQNLEEVLPLLRAKLREYLTLKLDLRSNARKFNCIAHEDHDPSMCFNPKTNEETVHCFACGWSGSIFDCAEKLEGLPTTGSEWITETIPTLCETLGIPLKMGEVSVADRERLRFMKLAQDLADTLVESSPDKIDYVNERNWKQDFLSYGCIDSGVLIAETMTKGWSSQDIKKSLLTETKYQRYFGEDRLTFVIKDHRGRAIGFIYKDLSKSGSPYVNSTESQIYNKSKALLGIDVALVEARQKGLYVVEGPGDLAQLYRVGITNAVAICGTAFTEHHLLYLKNLGIQKIFLCLDWDKAGYAATARILEDVLKITSGTSAYVVTAPESDIKDPDELLRKSKTTDPFFELTVLSGFEWKLTQFRDEGPDYICDKMIPIIASEPTAVRREMLIKSLAEFTDLSYQAILTDVRAILEDKFNKFKERIVATAEQSLLEIKEDPEAVRAILSQQEVRVEEIESELNKNTMGINHQLARHEAMLRDLEDTSDESDDGFKMDHFPNFAETFAGGHNWSKDCLFIFPGRANSGKTAMVLALGSSIALSDEDALFLVHSTDDTYRLIEPRLRSNLYHLSNTGGPLLEFGMLAQPKRYLPDNPDYKGAYLYAQDLFKQLLVDERLAILDAEDGRSISTLERHIRYYRKKYPSKKILVGLDKRLSPLLATVECKVLKLLETPKALLATAKLVRAIAMAVRTEKTTRMF
jgi:DNA primase catalytic core